MKKKKESAIQKAERFVRRRGDHNHEERSFLIDMMLHIDSCDEDSERMLTLRDKIQKLIDEWNAEDANIY